MVILVDIPSYKTPSKINHATDLVRHKHAGYTPAECRTGAVGGELWIGPRGSLESGNGR